MSWLTVIWSVCISASAMLAVMHLVLCLQDRRRRYHAWSALACVGAAATGVAELGLMKAETLDGAMFWLFWSNVSAAAIVIALTWLVFVWFETARQSIAMAITGLWGAALVISLIVPGNLTFSLLEDLAVRETFWGESYSIPTGQTNPWKWMPDLASVLFLIYVGDASVRLARLGWIRRAAVVGGGMVFFIISAGTHAVLVDAGVVASPYLISFFFLAIVASLTFELVREAALAAKFSEELRKARSELEHFGRVNLLGELSSTLAHELNQPLSAILANAQAGSRFLESGEPDLGELRSIFRDIERDDRRARDVIQRTRAMLKRGDGSHQRLDLRDAVVEVIQMLRGGLASHGIELDVRLWDGKIEVLGDRVGVQQIVTNLLLNAERAVLQSAASDRRVSVVGAVAKSGVQIAVADSGSGVAEENLDRVFEPFFTTEESGIGMGLSICRSIAEVHGGSIAVTNGERGGAEFVLTLPLASRTSKG